MSAQHNAGLLYEGKLFGTIINDNPVPEIYGSEETEYYGGHLIAESVSPANRRRIIACWNACEGISTEALEDEAPRKLREDRDQILVQRNELLELLQGVLKCERGMLGHLVLELWQEEVIRSAIAKATGGAA